LEKTKIKKSSVYMVRSMLAYSVPLLLMLSILGSILFIYAHK
jgi:hypothetical protein